MQVIHPIDNAPSAHSDQNRPTDIPLPLLIFLLDFISATPWQLYASFGCSLASRHLSPLDFLTSGTGNHTIITVDFHSLCTFQTFLMRSLGRSMFNMNIAIFEVHSMRQSASEFSSGGLIYQRDDNQHLRMRTYVTQLNIAIHEVMSLSRKAPSDNS